MVGTLGGREGGCENNLVQSTQWTGPEYNIVEHRTLYCMVGIVLCRIMCCIY